jgi:hypothetical protein
VKNLGHRILQGQVFLVIFLLTSSVVAMSMPTIPAFADSGCQLDSANGKIKHVIYIQFDNVHLTRDNPNVPSDLEQMPHLLNFFKDNGIMSGNEHTPLISHTGDDIITSETGVYGDRHGQPVANSFGYFTPTGDKFGSSFTYWTDPVATSIDTTFNLLTATGQNAPAPWVPYTRAGCNFGAVALADMELENVGSDITTVFGSSSPQATEAHSNFAQAVADFEGISIHCASGNSLCSTSNGGASDVLPDEPGGYSGYAALYGHKYIAPLISSSLPMTDLDGKTINGTNGIFGFPGFNGMSAAVSLSYVASMQEHGVPVTFAYISDAHDHNPNGPAYGPGQAGYVATLAAYDDAFNKFFNRLNSDGINPSNTLFVVTADEGDHFVGGPPSPANCNGVTIPCTYSKIGEIDTDLTGILATEQGITTPFDIHFDDAPTFYLLDPTVNPSPTNPAVRAFEQATGKLTAVSPITGNTDKLAVYMADPIEEKLLHMVTADPLRTPTFTMFGDPDYYFETGSTSCGASCVNESPAFAWNHGDVQPEIVTTFLGMAGPGIEHKGIDNKTWSDHTDIRPTMMMLLGLKDDYTHDGRALVEDLKDWAIPATARDDSFRDLAVVYKKINAPVGELALNSLKISTKALNSTSAGDVTYTDLENKLTSFTTERNTLQSQMINLLEGAEFGNQHISDHVADDLTHQANELLDKVKDLSG